MRATKDVKKGAKTNWGRNKRGLLIRRLCAWGFVLFGITILLGTMHTPHSIEINCPIALCCLLVAIALFFRTKGRIVSEALANNLCYCLLAFVLMVLEGMALYRIACEGYPVFG